MSRAKPVQIHAIFPRNLVVEAYYVPQARLISHKNDVQTDS